MTTPEEMKKPLGVGRELLGDAGVSFLPALTASMIANSRRTDRNTPARWTSSAKHCEDADVLITAHFSVIRYIQLRLGLRCLSCARLSSYKQTLLQSLHGFVST